MDLFKFAIFILRYFTQLFSSFTIFIHGIFLFGLLVYWLLKILNSVHFYLGNMNFQHHSNLYIEYSTNLKKKSNNSFIIILVLKILKFRNISHSTFNFSKFRHHVLRHKLCDIIIFFLNFPTLFIIK